MALLRDAGGGIVIKVGDVVTATAPTPANCDCCDAEVCPTNCTSCPNVLTATITCPNATFPGPITFTKQGQPTGCSWIPGFISGYNITSFECDIASSVGTCAFPSPGFDRFNFCISVTPGGEACDTLGSNIEFHKAVASGCPATGLYTSSKVNWTCTMA